MKCPFKKNYQLMNIFKVLKEHFFMLYRTVYITYRI
jgi:hypothetical protein